MDIRSLQRPLKEQNRRAPSASRITLTAKSTETATPMMNLAWSDLNRTTPDLDGAEQNARSALKPVPYWHYVRDILLPQIQTAKAAAKS